MRPLFQKFFYLFVLFFLVNNSASGQLVLTPNPGAQALAQKLVGDGITISNVSFIGSVEMAGIFNNQGGTNINIDSGIVLTNGRVIARPPGFGVAGPVSVNADNGLNLAGDGDLGAVSGGVTHDACILQFDFVPLGDSIKFNYVFSSEEYPEFACGGFNDAFAFFISGPGFPTLTNIALIPNTTLPVTIDNINDKPGCGLFPQYYVPNTSAFFTHDGHTTVFTAFARVQPCQTYTLKLVIADVGDFAYDSGVFLQAKSLTSNVVGMNNVVQTDPGGNSYLAEGCLSGDFVIRRPRKDPTPLVVNLSYGGVAVNGTDVQLLPASVIIPANDSFVVVNVVPIQDGLAEGVEPLKVYALGGCSGNIPADSITILIRDYDFLPLVPDSAIICRNGSIQLNAGPGYTVYQWNPDPTLNNPNIANPIASPVNAATTYSCSGTAGNCNAQGSVYVELKMMEFVSKTDVNCRAAATGSIKVGGGPEWTAPVEFSLDGINWQPDSTFNNLPVGVYWVKMRDATCIDSIPVTVNQAFPDLLITNNGITPASCTGGADGILSITATGGSNPIQYSLDGINFQNSNIFTLASGNYTVTIRDNNGCTDSRPAVVTLNNTVSLDAGTNPNICEGTTYLIPTVSNADSYVWTPAATLDDATKKTPVASPVNTTKYYVTATTGVCTRVDSVEVFVRPAPVANAGSDITICFGKEFQLNGSGGVSYEWSPATNMITSPNMANPTVKAKDNIRYYLMVTDATGCKSITPDEMEVKVTPSVKIFAGNDTIAAINQPLQLKVIETGTSGVTQYNWSPGIFLNDPNIANPVATLPYDFRYIVTGTTPEGCEGTDDVFVKVYKGPDIYVPSGFTPNNDGLNDLLRAVAVGVKDFKYFTIFNRWGQQVFTTRDPARGWDGRINGIQQVTGTYVWIAEAVDYLGNLIQRKGVVTIIR